MIKQGEINSIAGKTGVRDTQIEKDYVLSWVLWCISKSPYLKENLVFKGGTVLRKVYFPKYRFSEDLSFTFKGDFEVNAIKSAFAELIKLVHDASRITLSLQHENQKKTGNFNFYISFTSPLGGPANKDIKTDITKDELICNAPEMKPVLNEYSDLVNEKYEVLCYTLDEIAAEKMCSVMQRTMPRDIYDLWYLFEMDGYDIEDCIFSFREKAAFKKLDAKNFVKVIEKKESVFAKQWKDHLSHQIAPLPEFRKVWRELGRHWKKLQRFAE